MRLPRRACLLLLLAPACGLALASPAAAKRKPEPVSAGVQAQYHFVHILFRGLRESYDPALPSHCFDPGFGANPGFCNGDYLESSPPTLAPFNNHNDGSARWDSTRPMRLRLSVKGSPMYLLGTLPDPGSNRFSVYEGKLPGALGNVESGNDPSIRAGDEGGPLTIDVRFYKHEALFHTMGYVRYVTPSPATLDCPSQYFGQVGRLFRMGCVVHGAPVPDVSLVGAPPGLHVSDVDGQFVDVEGVPGSAGDDVRFTVLAFNGFGVAPVPVRLAIIKGATAVGYDDRIVHGIYGEKLGFDLRLSTEAAAPTAPSGSVSFADGTTPMGDRPLTPGAGIARTSFRTTQLAPGGHTINVHYPGDANFNAVDDGSVTLDVDKDPSTMSLTPSKDHSQAGEPVSVRAQVAVPAPGAGKPTGTVRFKLDGQDLGAPVAVGDDGKASTDIAPPDAGDHEVSAAYSGNDFVEPSSERYTQQVDPEETTTTVRSSDASAAFGQSVRFTADVAARRTAAQRKPSGRIQFLVDDKPYGDPVELVDGRAESGSTSQLPLGTHTVSARYSGAKDFAESTDTLGGGQRIEAVDTRTEVTSSKSPAGIGEPITFSVAVTAVRGGGIVGGYVQLKIDDEEAGRMHLDKGKATSRPFDKLELGYHRVDAVFQPKERFPGYNVSNGTLKGGQRIVTGDAERATRGVPLVRGAVVG